jgi:Transposase DDE domain
VRLRGAERRAPFPASTCGTCALQADWTTSARGRPLSIHPHAALCIEWRQARQTAEGRQALRQRTGVEQTVARMDQRQGKRARYKGTRKNLLDLRRTAAVHNLPLLHRALALEQAA